LVYIGSVMIGGVGFACVESAAVLPEGRKTPSSLGLWNDEQQEALTR
jgi:2,4-dienoyl-CoA reductase-like NADH-dependent reductase (Old Yellow Enzyme family)